MFHCTDKKFEEFFSVNNNSVLGTFAKIIFLRTSIFETLFFLKSCPIFDELSQKTMISFDYIILGPRQLVTRYLPR